MLGGRLRGALQRAAAWLAAAIVVLGTPPDNLDVVAMPIADNPLVVLARNDHPLAGTKPKSSLREGRTPAISSAPRTTSPGPRGLPHKGDTVTTSPSWMKRCMLNPRALKRKAAPLAKTASRNSFSVGPERASTPPWTA